VNQPENTTTFDGLSMRLATTSIFLISLAVLALEVSLTRFFSVVLRYHFVFLVTSIAVCGLGLGGWAAHLRLRKGDLRCRPSTLSWDATGFAVSLLLGILFLLRVWLPRYPEL